jgi:hypothetical protein
VNGPSKRTLGDHSGLTWAARLLEKRWRDVDIISWHQWNIRDLEATDFYHDTVSAASGLNRKMAKARGEAPKKLAISQTNISSGAEISPYEQDTIYAGLWWAAVLAEVIGAGDVNYINWFKSVDEGVYRKGVMRCKQGDCTLKPVGRIMAEIHEKILPWSLGVTSSAHEIRAFATADEGETVRKIVMVNTSRRPYRLKIEARGVDCPSNITLLSDADEDGGLERADLRTKRGAFSMPPLSIAIADQSNPSCEAGR